MNDKPSILIVDSNEAFAKMLQEGLEQEDEYQATVTSGGEEALQALSAGEFDLAIVDLGLGDPDDSDETAVARDLRQQQDDLRLMLIPLEGEELPSELADLGVQGTLPKPFFLPELPGRIAEALTKPLVGEAGIAETEEPGVASAQPVVGAASLAAERLAELRECIPEITQEMIELSREINAEAVVLTRGEEVIASAGRLSGEELSELARVVVESWHASARMARILGREQLRFEQSVEGGEYVFYSLAIAEEIILSMALRADVPLGIIRHQAKETARALRDLISAAQ